MFSERIIYKMSRGVNQKSRMANEYWISALPACEVCRAAEWNEAMPTERDHTR